MLITSNLLSPIVKTSIFFKLSNSLIIKLFSFLTDQEVANITGCNRIFPPLQEKYFKLLNEERLFFLEKLISSKEKVVSCDGENYQMKMHNDSVSFTCSTLYSRHFLDLKTLTICPEKILAFPIKSGKLNEKVSVVNKEGSKVENFLFGIIDNTKKCVIDWIEFPREKNECVVTVFGTDKDPGNSLEIVSSKGKLFLYTPSCRESDKKESNAKLKSLCCIPEIYRKFKCKLKKAFKVKNSYYFQWEIGHSRPYKVITFIKDIFSSHQILLNHSRRCYADDYFFYATYKTELFIFKDGKNWKKLNLGPEVTNVKLRLSDYGLVILFTHMEGDRCTSKAQLFQCLAIWNHRKYEPNVISKNFLFYKKFSNRLNYFPEASFFISKSEFICKDVLFYKTESMWSVYHIPTQKELGIITISSSDIIQDICILNQDVPKYLVINIKDEKSQFRVFTIEENK